MLFQGSGDLFLTQKTDNLKGAVYSILKWFADPRHGSFDILTGEGSESECKPIAMGSDFQLCDIGSRQKEARRANCVIHVDENSSGGSHGEKEKYEVRSVSDALGNVAGMNCGCHTSERIVFPEIVDT